MLVFLLAGVASAQLGNMLVKRSDKGLYVDHTVVAKEGLFSIGRIYYVHPHHLAAFNGIELNQGLKLGQTLHIPLTDTNFNQRSDEGFPVYYEIAAGEGLSAVSRQHNRVALEKLRDWNNLSTDNISKGTKLIVGYLSLGTTSGLPVATVESPKAVVENKTPVADETSGDKPATGVKDESPAQVTTASREAEKPAAAEVKAVVSQPVSETKPAQQTTPAHSDGAGFFKPYFEEQVKRTPAKKQATVTSGVFKTTSGWQDAKYYLLIDNVSTGSIVRISNPNNNQVVYAKVLGQMNGIRQNQGLDIRISNAAASALGVNEDDKFVVQINY